MNKFKHGGERKNSGRPPKPNKEAWGQITCVLRKDTIEKLHAGAGGGKFFGAFLQHHLDRYPLPSFEDYCAWLKRRPVVRIIQKRRVPVIISAGAKNRIKRPPRPKTVEDIAFEQAYSEVAESENRA